MEPYIGIVYQLIRDGKPLFPLVTSELDSVFTVNKRKTHQKIRRGLYSFLENSTYDNRVRTKNMSVLAVDLDADSIKECNAGYNTDNIYFYIRATNMMIPTNSSKFGDITLSIYLINSNNIHVKKKKLSSYKCDRYILHFLHKFQKHNCGFLVSFNDLFKYLKKENIEMSVDTFFELYRNKNILALLPFYNILNEFDDKLQ